jgi:hypothetical protein
MSASDDRLDELIRNEMRKRECQEQQKQACPKEEQLVLYLENRLNEAEREALESHMADCGFCIDLILGYVQPDNALPDQSVTVPKKVIDRAKSLVAAPEPGLKSRFQFPARLRWRWSLAWAIPLLFMLLLPIGYLTGKSLLKGAVETRMQRMLTHSGFSVAGLDVGWGQILLNGIVLAQEEADPVSIKSVSVKFEPQSLVAGKLALNQVVMDSPHVRVGEEGLDISSLLDKLFPEDLVRPQETDLFLSSAQILVKNGSVDIIDEQVPDGPVVLRFDQLNLNADGLSYPSAQTASVQINGRIEGIAEHGRIKGQGEINPVEGKLTLLFHLQGIDMVTMLPYYADQVSAHLESGTTDVELNLNLADKVLSISGKFILHSFKFTDYEGFFFGLPPELMEEFTDQGLEIPFEISGQVNAGQEYFHGALLREFEQGLLEQID